MDKEETSELILLVCPNEKKPTFHTIDGMLLNQIDRQLLPDYMVEKYKGYRLYTCQECKGGFYYREEDLPIRVVG